MLLARLSLLLALACLAHSQAFLPASMTEAINASLYLDRFGAAAIAAGYASMFDSPDFNGTVFVPVDSAFPNVTASDGAPEEPAAAAAAAAAAPPASATTNSSALSRTIAFHIVPGIKAFPMSTLKQGVKLPTLVEGHPLYIDRTVPGVIHVYGNDPKKGDPANFASILQYQEIRGGKAILYVIDKVLKVPAEP